MLIAEEGEGLLPRSRSRCTAVALLLLLASKESRPALLLNRVAGEGVSANIGDRKPVPATVAERAMTLFRWGEGSRSKPVSSESSGRPSASSTSAILSKLPLEARLRTRLSFFGSDVPLTSVAECSAVGSAASALMYIVLARGAGDDIDIFDLRCRDDDEMAVRSK